MLINSINLDLNVVIKIYPQVENIIISSIQTGPMGWIKRQMDLGIGPRDILAYMAPYAQIVS